MTGDGYVVQKIKYKRRVWDDSGNLIDEHLDEFWELWHVFGGVAKYYDPKLSAWVVAGDQFSEGDKGEGTKGVVQINATAVFYGGPPTPPSTPSGFVPSTPGSGANPCAPGSLLRSW